MTPGNARIDHFVKTTILLAVALALVSTAGCKPSNRVTFKPALVSIDPGEGWKQMDLAADPPKCSPRLMGKPGMINALHFSEQTDVKKVAEQMQTSLSGNSNALQDSFKQEPFSTDSGLNGIHLSYTARSGKDTAPDMRSHSFVTHNRRGECVSISYITSPERESAATLEAIRKTLRVE
jgi:hypothetical protein